MRTGLRSVAQAMRQLISTRRAATWRFLADEKRDCQVVLASKFRAVLTDLAFVCRVINCLPICITGTAIISNAAQNNGQLNCFGSTVRIASNPRCDAAM